MPCPLCILSLDCDTLLFLMVLLCICRGAAHLCTYTEVITLAQYEIAVYLSETIWVKLRRHGLNMYHAL